MEFYYNQYSSPYTERKGPKGILPAGDLLIYGLVSKYGLENIFNDEYKGFTLQRPLLFNNLNLR